MAVIGLSLGWYLFCLVLALIALLKYVNDRLLLKKTSVGQTVGFLFVVFLFGSLIGVLLAILVGKADWLITFLACLVYVSIFISIMGMLRTYALFYAKKKIGLDEFNKATKIERAYNTAIICNVFAIVVILAGVFMGSLVIMLGGFLLSVCATTSINLKFVKILEQAEDLTAEDRAKKADIFNQALEAGTLDELDNTDKTLYKKSKRQATKYLKKRG